jgi:hypothetical protein
MEGVRPEVPGYLLLAPPPRTGRTARVFQAVSETDGRPFAIKVLTASVEQGEFLDEAFRRETQALARLRHDNIVRMSASGVTPTGDRYIVLDWMASDLTAWKASQAAFDWPSFWSQVGRPIAMAVAHAHANEVYHRDLAPRNILLHADGRPMVADFGIAKLRRFMRTEKTLKEFVSPPFTPPESDDGSGLGARDVFSLASIFCWCAAPHELATWEEVRSFASATERFPAAVRDVLLEALSVDPDDRPRLAEQLVERLDGAVATNLPRSALTCQLALGIAQADRIARDFGLRDRASAQNAVLEDLHAVCGIEPMPGKDGSVGDAFGDLTLYGLTRSYHVRPDDHTRDHLVILGVRQRPTGWLEARREKAIMPKVEFRFTSRGMDADRRALASLQELVDSHLRAREEAEASVESRLLDTWARILQAKQDVESTRERPIRFSGHRIDGKRVLFRTVGALPDVTVLEKRQIRLRDGSFLMGHIGEIDEGELTFVVSQGDALKLPETGDIVVNVYAAAEAIRKQTRALEAFRQRDVVRPHMADVLLDPMLASPAVPQAPAAYFQKDLDPDKRVAVDAALGSPDVLLLRGPPGTGKTTFIAELVMQELARNPSARILLCSQTNVAIDNAIERVGELAAEAGRSIEVVRIGTNDDRISPAVDRFRLHRRLQAWTQEVTTRVEAYAERRAAEIGIERSTVLIGMALEQLVTCDHDARCTDELIAERERELEAVSKRNAQEGNPRLDADVAGSVAARRLELSQLRERRRLSRSQAAQLRDRLVELGEPELASVGGADLDSALELYLEGARAAGELKPLIELGADWTARFGRQDHFEAPFLSTVQVLSGTCLGVVGSKSLSELSYDLCIVDEASKATPTEMLVPLSRSSRWVLVGDSKQLPPFQDEALRDGEILKEYELRREDVSESLFSYLERTLPQSNVVSLTTQRRMLKPINDLIASCFYPDQELVCARKAADRKLGPALKKTITWLDTSRSPKRKETPSRDNTGCSNKLECEVVLKLLRRLNRQFAKRDPEQVQKRVTVATITGYADQLRLLEKTLRPRSPTWTHLEIMLNTVDAFQGRQADMVVYSVARSNPKAFLGFLSKPPRLNVALSRGRDALVIVGDQNFCRSAKGENPFRDVILFIGRSDGCGVEPVE